MTTKLCVPVLMLGLAACATNPAVLEETAVASKIAPIDSAANIYVRSVTDNRSKDSKMTDMYGREMSGTDLIKWLENSLPEFGIIMADAERPENVACDVEIELRRAGISSANTTKFATIVLGVRDTETSEYNLYRGSETSVNWAGGKGETNSALSRALNNAVNKLAEDCQ